MSSGLLRSDFDPMVGGYVIIMVALAVGLWLSRRPSASRPPASRPSASRPSASRPSASRPSAPQPPARGSGPDLAPVTAAGWGRLARYVAGTMLGGYLLLMLVVILYYYLVARVGGAFIESAFTGCALLLGLAAPVFAAASWLTRGRPGRRSRPTRTRLSAPGEGSGRS